MKHLVSGTVLTAIAAMASMSPATAEDLTLGFSMAKTGPFVSLTITNEIAVDMAVEKINASGGVDGKKIKLVKFDTGGDPKQASISVSRFAKDDSALGVIGPFSSSECRVAFPAGERLKIPQIAIASAAPNLSKPFAYGFRNSINEGAIIGSVMKALQDKGLPAKTAAIAHATDDVVSKAIGTKVLPPLFEQYGIEQKKTVTFQYKAFDVSTQVSQIKAENVDLVGLGSPPEAALKLAKELQRQEVDVRLIAGTPAADPDLPKRMDGAGQRMTIGATFFGGYDESTKSFSEAFAERAKAAGISRTEPNMYDVNAYQIAMIYAEVMRRAKVTGEPSKVAAERAAIQAELAKLKDFPTLAGEVSFNSDGDALKPIYVMEIVGREWELLGVYNP